MPGRRRRNKFVAAGWLLAMTAAAVAAPSPGASSDGSFSDLLGRIEQLEKDNASLRDQVSELKAQTGDQWLSEQRAAEIRALVSDVLADVDARQSLLQNGMTAGWDSQSGYFMASNDGRFKLQFDGMIQFRYVYNYHDEQDQHRQGFEATRTKLTFRGHAFSPNLTYLVRGLFSRDGGGGGTASSDVVGGEFRLQDVWIRWLLTNEWSVRAGQFKLPHNREELVAPQYQLLVERSMINESMNLGRSQGVELQYLGRDFRFQLAYSEGADDSIAQAGTLAGVTAPNTPALDRDTEYAFTVRNEHLIAGDWNQFEDMTSPEEDDFGLLIGYAAHYEQGENEGTFTLVRNEHRRFDFTIDASVEWGGANLFASINYDYLDSSGGIGVFNLMGGVLQGGVYVTPKTELFARFEYGRFVTNREDLHFPDLRVLTVGWNYYIDGHDLKWTTDFGVGFQRVAQIWQSNLAGYRADVGNGPPQVVFRSQIQLLF